MLEYGTPVGTLVSNDTTNSEGNPCIKAVWADAYGFMVTPETPVLYFIFTVNDSYSVWNKNNLTEDVASIAKIHLTKITVSESKPATEQTTYSDDDFTINKVTIFSFEVPKDFAELAKYTDNANEIINNGGIIYGFNFVYECNGSTYTRKLDYCTGLTDENKNTCEFTVNIKNTTGDDKAVTNARIVAFVGDENTEIEDCAAVTYKNISDLSI